MDKPEEKHRYRMLTVAGCADRSELALLNGLRRAGAGVDLLLDPTSPRRDEVLRQFPETGFLRVRHRLDLVAAARLRRRLRENPPDILYATCNRTLAASLMASRGLPVKIIAYRGTVGHLSRWDPAAWLTHLHPRLERIVCVSDAVAAYLRERIQLPVARLTRIYKGHDPAWYDAEAEAVPSRTSLGLPDRAVVVGFVGRMRPVKGVDVLLRCLDHLPPEVHLLLIGEVTDRRVSRLAGETPERRRRTHFTGPSDNVVGLLGCCDIFVMPSVAREGLPRAVIEAMCRRLPVVVSRVGGLPELVADGRCGLVVPPRDPPALAAAIKRLAADAQLRLHLGQAGRHQIATRFHIDQTLRQTLALHHEILKRANARKPACGLAADHLPGLFNR